MVRWFRRKTKAEVAREAEVPELREPEAEPGEAAEPAEAAAPPEPADIQAEASSGAEEPPLEAHIEAEAPAPAALQTPEDEEVLSPEEEARLAEVPEARRGLFRRFRERLGRTRKTFLDGFDLLFAKHPFVDEAFLEDLEELLITADLGVETALSLMSAMQERVRRRELSNVERLKAALKTEMLEMLTSAPAPRITARPKVVLMVGVNGVGKTTTIAKLAHRDRAAGRQPLLIAADTFRAAAAEQLEIWGQRVGAPVIRQHHGADPAAVVFDGLSAALSRGVDTVYIDTAGRLHTKVNLMEELKKIHRTTAKKLPGAPHEVLLVLDATTGQNAVSQARLFQEAVGLTGIVLTKLDGTAKGGVALAVVHETGIPLRFLGVGEGLEDLKPFDPEAFVEAILG
ncbi:MAG: signal recognition particle-docking protein FtsY [Deltaproteobacteria bacterium]|nr:signal recognition particle-docking protein FtsY [Deltaproteobacteria bacterium]